MNRNQGSQPPLYPVQGGGSMPSYPRQTYHQNYGTYSQQQVGYGPPQTAPMYPAPNEPPPPYSETAPPAAQYAPPQGCYGVPPPPPQTQPISWGGIHATFDAAARFDGVSQPRIPPPPPGVMPTAAQVAHMQGQSVTASQQRSTLWSGSGGGGSNFDF